MAAAPPDRHHATLASSQAESDDLYEKLEQLIKRHQAGAPARSAAEDVPLLSDSIEAGGPTSKREIPELSDAVERHASALAADDALGTKRRRLQVALYLRLRQRLDHELHAGLAPHATGANDERIARLAEHLRAALPRIVRDAVDQVLGAEERGASKL
jgi:hypothetical protein